MPIKELLRLALTYNQTMVVEDVTEGFGKYFIDCSTFVHYRGSQNWGITLMPSLSMLIRACRSKLEV